jgi:hypothetical protein
LAAPDFSESFQQSFDIQQVLSAALSGRNDGSSVVEVGDVVRRLRASYPEADMTPAQMAEAIVRAAADAGLQIAYRESVEQTDTP